MQQVGRGESREHASAYVGRARHFCRSSLEHVMWRPVSADRGKDARDALRIASRPKDAEHPRGSHAGEEALEINSQEKRAATVWPDESEQTPARAEAMRRPVRRYQVEDAVKHAALKHAQAGLGHLEQPTASTALGKPSIAIVAQRFIGDEAAQTLLIRQALH